MNRQRKPFAPDAFAKISADEIDWCSPVIESLEERGTGLACEWARLSLLATLENKIEMPHAGFLRERLMELPSLLARETTADAFGKMARDIWDHGPRTHMQTAVSKLFEAAGAFRDEASNGYRRCVAAAFTNAHEEQTELADIAVAALSRLEDIS